MKNTELPPDGLPLKEYKKMINQGEKIYGPTVLEKYFLIPIEQAKHMAEKGLIITQANKFYTIYNHREVKLYNPSTKQFI